MVIVETPVFTRRVLDTLSDDEYRELQEFLASHPDAGRIIPGEWWPEKTPLGGHRKGEKGRNKGYLLLASSTRDHSLVVSVQEERTE